MRKRRASKIYFAGSDIATDRELIASTSNVEEIASYIEADALIYQETNTLDEAST